MVAPMKLQALPIIVLLASGPWLACDSAGQTSGGSSTLAVETYTAAPAVHVPVGTDIAYASTPPCIGDHFPTWSAWGASSDPVEPGYFVHNLEHGGVVLLYDCPDGCADVVAALGAFAASVPDDDGGAFRYILSPYSGMSTRIAAVAWGVVYRADTVETADLDEFVAAHYRHGPEDVAAAGSHDPNASHDGDHAEP